MATKLCVLLQCILQTPASFPTQHPFHFRAFPFFSPFSTPPPTSTASPLPPFLHFCSPFLSSQSSLLFFLTYHPELQENLLTPLDLSSELCVDHVVCFFLPLSLSPCHAQQPINRPSLDRTAWELPPRHSLFIPFRLGQNRNHENKDEDKKRRKISRPQPVLPQRTAPNEQSDRHCFITSGRIRSLSSPWPTAVHRTIYYSPRFPLCRPNTSALEICWLLFVPVIDSFSPHQDSHHTAPAVGPSATDCNYFSTRFRTSISLSFCRLSGIISCVP